LAATSSYPARTRRNIEESDGTGIFSLEQGTKLTRECANKIGKPLLHIFDTRKERIFNPDLRRLEIQARTIKLQPEAVVRRSEHYELVTGADGKPVFLDRNLARRRAKRVTSLGIKLHESV
jgi:hypothetical protein